MQAVHIKAFATHDTLRHHSTNERQPVLTRRFMYLIMNVNGCGP